MLAAGALGALVAAGVHVGRALWWRAQVLESGGKLDALEAAYDVRRYDLAFTLRPDDRALAGSNVATVVATAPLATFEIDLDHRLDVDSVAVDGNAARFTHHHDRIHVELAPDWSTGERHRVAVLYHGRPKVSADPPWYDGFVWSHTADGTPWFGVTCELDGADDWWPAKDHPSDEPDDGVSIELTVPAGLVGLSNGRRVAAHRNADGSETTRWEVSTPINNYDVTVAAGPYVPIVERYHGADGSLDVPMTFWALPEHCARAAALWRRAPAILAVFARRFGEFPFLADKIGAVEAPFDGMEHQTLIALGDGLLPDADGDYSTLVHELAHEWWGNKISARDWDDFWIQEGFATYAEVLDLEDERGPAAARTRLEVLRRDVVNAAPLVSGHPRTAASAYDGDIYDKGAWVLATLRWQIGDAAFFRVLRRFSGEPPDRCRLVDSAELERLVAAESGEAMPWFWQRYLRAAELPRYSLTRQARGDADRVCLAWNHPGFALALPVEVDGILRRVEMVSGRACFEVPRDARVRVAREGRVLADPAGAPGAR